MTKDDLKTLLAQQPDREFVDRQLLEQRPWIFPTDQAYDAWRVAVTSSINLSRDSIRIVGSAALGFSLSPLKPGRPFRTSVSASALASDVDIAFVDWKLFGDAWDAIVDADRGQSLRVDNSEKHKLRLDVYWGVVADFSVPANTNPSRLLRTALSEAGRTAPIRGHPVHCRIYRRIDDLRAYHISSLRNLRKSLSA